jgi:hypothetical protein
MSLVVPEILSSLLEDIRVCYHFPALRMVFPLVVFGWLPALIISFAVWLAHEVVILVHARRIKNQESKI